MKMTEKVRSWRYFVHRFSARPQVFSLTLQLSSSCDIWLFMSWANRAAMLGAVRACRLWDPTYFRFSQHHLVHTKHCMSNAPLQSFAWRLAACVLNSGDTSFSCVITRSYTDLVTPITHVTRTQTSSARIISPQHHVGKGISKANKLRTWNECDEQCDKYPASSSIV